MSRRRRPVARSPARESRHHQSRKALTADASGEVNAVITLRPPAPANPRCPSGYAIQAWRVSYTNTTVMDEANNVTWSAPGSGGQAQ